MTTSPHKNDRLLAARSVRKQAKLLARSLGGIQASEESESIHRARVASRRVRAALDIFKNCWKRKQAKSWKKHVRQLADDLGEARDRDVQIEFLVAKLAGMSETALVPGMARVLSHIEQRRQWLQPRILQAIDRMKHSGVLKEMLSAARRVRGATAEVSLVPSEAARRRAGKSVRKRLKQLLAESPALASAAHSERHHAMRIAAKRLRYTLELAGPGSSKEFDEIVDSVKRLQTMLGEIHDCDVWAENLDAFAHSEAAQIHVFFGESRRFNRLLPGIEHLRNDRKARREQVFNQLQAFWRELAEKRTWARVIEMVESEGASAQCSNGAATQAASGVLS